MTWIFQWCHQHRATPNIKPSVSKRLKNSQKSQVFQGCHSNGYRQGYQIRHMGRGRVAVHFMSVHQIAIYYSLWDIRESLIFRRCKVEISKFSHKSELLLHFLELRRANGLVRKLATLRKISRAIFSIFFLAAEKMTSKMATVVQKWGLSRLPWQRIRRSGWITQAH